MAWKDLTPYSMQESVEQMLIKASPLLIAQPKKWVHKTPSIAKEG